MSIISVFEDVLDRSPEKSATGRKDDRIFKVRCDSNDTKPSEIYAHASIPDLNDPHPDDSSLLCSSIKPRRTDDRKIWKVVCEYVQKQKDATQSASGGGNNSGGTGEGQEDPCSEAPKVDWAFRDRQIVADKCYGYSTGTPTASGQTQGSPSYPVRNSATDPFDPPIMIDEPELIITIKKNVRNIDPNVIAKLNGTINAAEVTVGGRKLAVYEGLLKIRSAALAMDPDGRPYRQMEYEIYVKEGGHLNTVLDAGYRHLVAGEVTDIYMADINAAIAALGLDAGSKENKRVQDPVKLNGSGVISKTDGAYPGPSTYINFLCYWPANWKPLSLPTTFEQPYIAKTKNRGVTTA